jgi:hypothetical protein
MLQTNSADCVRSIDFAKAKDLADELISAIERNARSLTGLFAVLLEIQENLHEHAGRVDDDGKELSASLMLIDHACDFLDRTRNDHDCSGDLAKSLLAALGERKREAQEA